MRTALAVTLVGSLAIGACGGGSGADLRAIADKLEGAGLSCEEIATHKKPSGVNGVKAVLHCAAREDENASVDVVTAENPKGVYELSRQNDGDDPEYARTTRYIVGSGWTALVHDAAERVGRSAKKVHDAVGGEMVASFTD